MTDKELKRLSDLMLVGYFLSMLFYSCSYVFIYQVIVQAVPRSFLGIEQIVGCVSTIIFCKVWNKYSDRLFRYYRLILWLEIIFDVALFADVIIRGDLKFYFMFNIMIMAIITRNLICGRTKMKAKVNPTEKLREKFDNNSQIADSAATIIGATTAIIIPFSLNTLFVLALIGNCIDNVFFLYIYHKLKRSDLCVP
jgi:hypothetical protein